VGWNVGVAAFGLRQGVYWAGLYDVRRFIHDLSFIKCKPSAHLPWQVRIVTFCPDTKSAITKKFLFIYKEGQERLGNHAGICVGHAT